MSKKKVTRKKATSRKTKTTSVLEQFENSVIRQPIAIANKAFLASLGLAVTVQSGFSRKVDEFAKEGEAVRDEYQESFDKFRNDLMKQARTRRDAVVGRARSFVKTVADSSPLATDRDVHEVEEKVDEVLAEVAKPKAKAA